MKFLKKQTISRYSINDTTIQTNDKGVTIEPTIGGVINLKADTNVEGNLDVTGNVALGGNIRIGDQTLDTVTVVADFTSNLVPDVDNKFNLGTFDKAWKVGYVSTLDTGNIAINNNVIRTNESNSDLELSANGSGKIKINNDLVVSDNNTLFIGNRNLLNYDSTTWYVSEDSGNDANDGRFTYSAFASIKYALSQVASGDTIIVLPGTYSEEFPLTVPQGVTVKGSGLRATTIKPTIGTNTLDCFLMSGESTVEDLTIKDMFFDSFNNSGYAFRFASNITVAERSPYVQRVTVLNRGSGASANDPYGFLTPDSGRGVYLDGSQVTRQSVEAAILFNECTFIVPNSRALILTNGARTEWLNCFTYFADLAVEGVVGAQGRGGSGKTKIKFDGVSGSGFQAGETVRITSTDGSTVRDLVVESVSGGEITVDGKVDSLEGTDFTPESIVGLTSSTTATSITRYDRSEFAAEMRAISGANVYGNQGVKADGDDVVLQLMAWNFAYIGTGADLSNDKSTVTQSNEVIEINGGRVYYNSVDQGGNFRVGDLFSVNFETGAVSFEVPTFDITSLTGITFSDGTNTTVVNPSGIETPRFSLTGNTISTSTGPITLDPSGSENINLNASVNVIGNLDVTGNIDVDGNITLGGNIRIGDQNLDSIEVLADFTSDLTPNANTTYDLGKDDYRWKDVFANKLRSGLIDVTSNIISTNVLDTNLDIAPNGAGKVVVRSALDVEGNFVIRGNYDITTASISISGNTIASLVTNNDLRLNTSGTGAINVSSKRVSNVAEPTNASDAATKGYVDNAVGTTPTKNVMYVSIDGTDTNDGRSKARPKRTIESALADLTVDSALEQNVTIFVSTGDYTENNPLVVPAGVSIIGDNLRAVTIRPLNRKLDLFHVNNGVYLSHMTFKDHEHPAAAVAFPPDGSAGVIVTSPYVQNCTSMTTTGTGMRIDGAHSDGLRSMVVDAYTQYNQGGIGIHMLNRGNSQLVSVFTICCDKSILCESGGFCSVTNSNSSFGNYALWSDGVSSTLYSGTVSGNYESTSREITLKNLLKKPNIGDAVSFTGQGQNSTQFSTVRSSSPFKVGNVDIEDPAFSLAANDAKNIRQLILDERNKIKTDTITFLKETYPWFTFDTFKCTRDVGIIIEAVVDDMIFSTNYKSIIAGISYYRQSASKVIDEQKTETIAAINFVKTKVLKVIENDSTQSFEYVLIEQNFDTIIDIMTNGEQAAPAYSFPTPPQADANVVNASARLRDNIDFLAAEAIEFLTQNFPNLSYDQGKCERDIAFIVRAISYDMLYQGNSQTADAADEYYSGGVLQIDPSEKTGTVAAYTFIKAVAETILQSDTYAQINSNVSLQTTIPIATASEAATSSSLFDIVINLVNEGYSSTVTLERVAGLPLTDSTTVTFHQYSLITSSGHTFEWIGAGVNVNTALPYLGGINIQTNEVIEQNGGRVYFTSTDQRGDFRIGKDLVINRDSGTISGRTFTKSLFALMTPYTLAIGE